MSPLERLRQLVGAWAAARTDRALARWRGEDDGELSVKRARAALGTGEARSLLESARGLGLIDDVDLGVWLGHLAEAAHDEILSRRGAPGAPSASREIQLDDRGARLADLLAAPERWLEPERREALTSIATELDRARREATAEADAMAQRVLARGPQRPERALDAEGWLRATDDAVLEARARASHALAGTGLAPPNDPDARVLRSLRASALDGLVPREGRVPRAARALEPLGADARGASRLRIVEHADATLAHHLAIVQSPRRVVLALSGIELGLATEIDVLAGLASALVVASASPALGLEHRLTPSEPACATGALVRLLPTDRKFLARQLGLDARTAEVVRAVAVYLWLADARLTLARALARSEALPIDAERAHALASRAIGASRGLPGGPLLVSVRPTRDLQRAAWAAVAAPSLFAALRERHDEDWFRNPRARDTLEGAGARGTRLSLDDWASELGAGTAHHADEAARFAREALR